MDDVQKVRIGIIGTGVGLRTLLPGFRAVPAAEVVGLVGSSPERGSAMAEKHGLQAYSSSRELCESSTVDLVCVASPNTYHHADVLCALEHGKHVLAEKPLAMTVAEVDQLIKAANQTACLAVVDHQLRFNPYLRAIRSMIQNGELGRVYYIRVHQQGTGFSDLNAAWSWSFDADLGGGVRLAMASHLVDLVRFWVSDRSVHAVSGALDVVVGHRPNASGDATSVRASSFVGAELALGEQLRVQLSATAAAFSGSRFDCEIYGTDGELRFDLVNKLQASLRQTRGKLTPIEVADVFTDERENRVSIFSGSFRYFAPRLVAAVAGDRSATADASSFSDARANQVILDAILASARCGSAVVLDEGYSCNALV